jgi:hypothetical protein
MSNRSGMRQVRSVQPSPLHQPRPSSLQRLSRQRLLSSLLLHQSEARRTRRQRDRRRCRQQRHLPPQPD